MIIMLWILKIGIQNLELLNFLYFILRKSKYRSWASNWQNDTNIYPDIPYQLLYYSYQFIGISEIDAILHFFDIIKIVLQIIF